MLNKNINFNKNETKSKMENPTTVLERRAPCASADIRNTNLKCNGDELELAKEKREHFLSEGIFLTFVLSQCIVY